MKNSVVTKWELLTNKWNFKLFIFIVINFNLFFSLLQILKVFDYKFSKKLSYFYTED